MIERAGAVGGGSSHLKLLQNLVSTWYIWRIENAPYMRCTSLTICAGSLDRRIQRYINQRDIESVEHRLYVAQDSLSICVSSVSDVVICA